jgi:LCP family protein required for cell wall assembly
VANISPQSNKINLISVPRDLWFYETNSKVNEIYPLADKSKDLSLIKSNFSLLTGQNINNYLIISTQDLIDFVTVINGVDVNLEKGFVDKQYPNPEYIVNPKPETPIYVTVEFKAGVNHLDGSNITQFVRSRKSSDNPNEGGTDLGRIKRQQILFAAILSKLSRADFYTKTSNLAKLYNFWSTHLKTDLTDTDITRIALSFGKELNHININRSELSVADSSSGPGLIYHPNSFINKQWVFIPKTKDYSDIKKFFLETFK